MALGVWQSCQVQKTIFSPILSPLHFVSFPYPLLWCFLIRAGEKVWYRCPICGWELTDTYFLYLDEPCVYALTKWSLHKDKSPMRSGSCSNLRLSLEVSSILFSLESSRVWCLILKLLVHLELMIVCSERKGTIFNLLYKNMQFSQYHLLKCYFFIYCAFLYLCQIPDDCRCMDLFLSLWFCFIDKSSENSVPN